MPISNRYTSLFAIGAGLFVAFALGYPNRAQQIPSELISYPDAILTNGKVLTVDSNFSIVEAVAIRDGRVFATGSSAEIERFAGPDTQRLDLQGKTVIPGIVDTHAHLQDMALNQFSADVAAIEPKFRDFSTPVTVGGKTVEEVLEKIRQVVLSRRSGSWVRVTLADPQTIGPSFYERVRRQQLDAVAPENPLAVHVYSILDVINTRVIDQM